MSDARPASVPREVVRLAARSEANEELGAALRRVGAYLARIHLIEQAYLQAMHKTELAWLRRLITEVRSGRFAWDQKKILGDVRAARRSVAARKERSE